MKVVQDRRDFLRFMAMSAVYPLLSSCSSLRTAGGEKGRPNVLFIISDDLNDWALHPAGHPKAKTPNMDRLRERSVSFSNAHVAVPVCGPSRKCLLSGLYPQTIDDYGFGEWKANSALKASVPFPRHFRDNGYNSYGTGKILHRGAEGDFYTEFGIAPDYGPWPWKGKGKVMNTPNPRQYEEWIEHLPVRMHRDLNYGSLSDVPVWPVDENTPGAKGWYYESGKEDKYVDADNRDKMPDEISTDWAIDVINKKHDKPFFLGVGFIRPHSPLYVPKKYFDMFPIEEIELPPYLKDDLKDCAPVLRERWQWGYKKFEGLLAAGGEKAWKEWVQAYLASMAFVDDQAGKVLHALENSDHADNTIVILTGDNGYHIGEKDCIQKWHLWNDSTKVPLIIKTPNMKTEGVCSHPVSLIDIYPTLTDLCSLPENPNKGKSDLPLAGNSLRPFLENPKRKTWPGPSAALMAIQDDLDWSAYPPSLKTARKPKDGPHFSICTERYRYTLCANGQEELYDHKKDPHEWTNLAGDEKYTKAKGRLRKELLSILKATSIPEDFMPGKAT